VWCKAISAISFIYLVVKSSVVYTAGSVDQNWCIVLVLQFCEAPSHAPWVDSRSCAVFTLAEMVMLNLLVRRWKSDDWMRLTKVRAAPQTDSPGPQAAQGDAYSTSLTAAWAEVSASSAAVN
jgi:hypothetical protein